MSGKILVVEDNVNNQLLIRDILEYHGYKVITANNGEEGIRMAREYKPALICMDLQMPVMDGLTAIRILKGDPETNGIIVLAVTSFAMVGDREKALEAGADDYITKPINTRDLPLLIEKLLGV